MSIVMKYILKGDFKDFDFLKVVNPFEDNEES